MVLVASGLLLNRSQSSFRRELKFMRAPTARLLPVSEARGSGKAVRVAETPTPVRRYGPKITGSDTQKQAMTKVFAPGKTDHPALLLYVASFRTDEVRI